MCPPSSPLNTPSNRKRQRYAIFRLLLSFSGMWARVMQLEASTGTGFEDVQSLAKSLPSCHRKRSARPRLDSRCDDKPPPRAPAPHRPDPARGRPAVRLRPARSPRSARHRRSARHPPHEGTRPELRHRRRHRASHRARRRSGERRRGRRGRAGTTRLGCDKSRRGFHDLVSSAELAILANQARVLRLKILPLTVARL